ncbi:hypothetical protein C3469_00710 [Mycobacterium kansasii]|uniref:hypothetical protein n=1 Tax=Mycobacterium kansasii TaxID=1768 RepID=UPI000CDE0352|nr:hypothetical protein [Mycobacterium kansasii]POY03245.1 hypothetical protein C3479_06470 [Mycobacterium kansasii]POY30087.1 hypothetical protein C3469_00710 [Mycobacterium kansasii]POY34540.1 hypothetical protein C3478_00710 [Mycobacterium kansasii]
MANRLDVAERLAEGRPALERTETYVRACQQLGYHHPDLTSRPGQISDWYDSEEGLDLYALDADCAQLRAVGTAITEALRIQRAQVLELAAAWAGPGADAAVRFLQRHCDDATTLATEVRAAAQRCESLRDNLWQLIDSKVATAIAIDDRALVERPVWSAAAGTVLAGAGERHMAEEVLRGQVIPYVDNDIRGDWLTAMRSTLAGMTASYDMVTDRLAAAPRVCFETAGDLGPGWSAWPIAPKAAAIPAGGMLDTLPSDPAPAQTAVAPATPAAPTTAPTPSGLGAAMGDGAAVPLDGSGGLGGAGGLGELAGRIVDAMADLLGTATGPHADPLGSESPAVPDDPMGDDDADDAGPDEAGKIADAKEAGEAGEPGSGTGTDGAAAAMPPVARLPSGAEPPAVGTAPDAEPPAAGPLVTEPPAGGPSPASAPVNGSPPQPATNGSTPCEIAADELPKAGQ